MKIFEFARSEDRSLVSVKDFLATEFGKLDRVGGPQRIYEVEHTDQNAALFVTKDGNLGIGLAWEKKQHKNLGVTTVHVWPKFDPYAPAPFAIDIPLEFDFADVKYILADLIRSPRTGRIYADSTGKLTEMARRSTDGEFMQMCRDMYGEKANYLSMPEMMACANKNDVQIPGSIRGNPSLKVDAHHWNLSGGDGPQGDNTAAQFKRATGSDIEAAPEDSPEIASLKAINGISKMASQGKVYLFGRKPNGAFYKIPGAEHVIPQLERLLARALPQQGEHSMDEQYEMLTDRVRLVAGGESNFIKSLLVTGAPSSGKTFTVLKTIRELGLTEGEDFAVKKGRITTLAMYRTLIEQLNGMAIFDDCDSVVDDKNAINMLKGALDTDPVREISYDVRGTVNTAVMSPRERDDFCNRCSRILRGKPAEGDLEYYFLKVRKPVKIEGEWVNPDIEDEDMDVLLEDVQDYVVNHLPNKIDFKGRIIFISNMQEDEWDSAILTRAFTMNMNFRSDEMIDYIDKIKGHIKTPTLTDEQKQEVMDYIRELYISGKLKRDVNFRLVQQAFDLRLTDSWKKLIAML